ncbi:MAG: tripartite tricarboxylate transporter permease [Deltaproteobacteria bacterium]|nr:tripartite tricarboxylate transporter permease [Deltaproteobacteria bacterium]
MWDQLLYGLSVAGQPANLLYCFIGCFYGTAVGVLPGFGPAAAIALLLPITFGMKPASAIIMFAGIYYGAMFGGSTTSILVNIPGEAASVVTTFDGYQMARQGRAGSALGISAIGSFVAGTLAVVGLCLVSPLVANFALQFGPPEFFSLMILGLAIVIFISFGSVIKGVMMGLLGIILGAVGWDVILGQPRITFGIEYLADGIPVIPVVMGLFGISEVFINLEKTQKMEVFKDIKNILPSLKELRESTWPILRGTGVGFFLGLLPIAGTVVAPFAAYTIEKKISRNPEKFGKGAIAGVAAPESANNAAAQAGFIPLLTLGIPVSAVYALVLAGFLIHGVHPGPLLLTNSPDVFWGVIMSMYIGNIFLLILNLPLIRMWIKVLEIPYSLLFPLILIFCLIGSLEGNRSGTTLVMIIFGILGYLMRKFEYEPAPMIIAFIISPILEMNFRQSLIISNGNFNIFFTKPISAVCLAAMGALFLLVGLYNFKAKVQNRRKQTIA